MDDDRHPWGEHLRLRVAVIILADQHDGGALLASQEVVGLGDLAAGDKPRRVVVVGDLEAVAHLHVPEERRPLDDLLGHDPPPAVDLSAVTANGRSSRSCCWLGTTSTPLACSGGPAHQIAAAAAWTRSGQVASSRRAGALAGAGTTHRPGR